MLGLPEPRPSSRRRKCSEELRVLGDPCTLGEEAALLKAVATRRGHGGGYRHRGAAPQGLRHSYRHTTGSLGEAGRREGAQGETGLGNRSRRLQLPHVE